MSIKWPAIIFTLTHRVPILFTLVHDKARVLG